VDNVDYTHMISGGLNGLLKRQGEQNERAMHNILGHAGRKVSKKQRRGYLQGMLQDPGNKQKLRRPHVLTPVPMGLPLTSADWNKKDLDKWSRKHVPNWHLGRRIIDVVSNNSKMDSYYCRIKRRAVRETRAPCSLSLSMLCVMPRDIKYTKSKSVQLSCSDVHKIPSRYSQSIRVISASIEGIYI
jgi:hypothetical protein